MNLETAIAAMNAEARGVPAEALTAVIAGFAIDSRQLSAGELFFALSPPDYQANGFNGDFNDAHQYIPQALAEGALAVVARADRVAADDSLTPYRDRLLLVEDCIAALQRLAAWVYRQWQRPVIRFAAGVSRTRVASFVPGGVRASRNLPRFEARWSVRFARHGAATKRIC